MGSGSRLVEVRRSALVAHPAARMFAIIEAAEDYPAFLPWCAGATILERNEQLVSARLQVAWRGVRFSFVTRNPKRAPEWMSIGLQEGPFRRFDGHWHLTPLAEWGCRVEFTLSYEMNSAILGALAGPVFDHAVNTLVDAFLQRADQVAAGLAQIGTPANRADTPPDRTAVDEAGAAPAPGAAGEGPPPARTMSAPAGASGPSPCAGGPGAEPMAPPVAPTPPVRADAPPGSGAGGGIIQDSPESKA
jgi:ribosome-associated toxin RatA of RatAB toxin-antitoxin module